MDESDIISRKEWGARPPRRRYRITCPTRDLWQHHTVGDYRGAAGIRAIQNFHMDGRGWSDIAYSFVIDRRTLEIYEGRGWCIAGGHTAGHNTTSHAICVTGNFELYQPIDALLRRIAELVAYGHENGKWPATLTGGHRDASGANTACPGKYLYLKIPQINRYALNQETPVDVAHIERIERAIAELGYTVDIDKKIDDREADAVENMVEGINNLMAVNEGLTAQVAELKKQLENSGTDARHSAAGANLEVAIRALGVEL